MSLQSYRFTSIIRSPCRKWKGHRHVRPKGSQSKRERHEERSGSIRPFIDEIQWVPQDLPIVEDHPCAGNRDADEPKERERDWDDSELNVLPSGTP